MCLTLTIRVPVAGYAALAAAVAALPPTALPVEPPRGGGHVPRWPWARPREPEAVAPCLCDLLSDEADWNAPTWAMSPDAREPLAQTLEHLARAVPGAVVEVLWVGERPAQERRVTPAALAALARRGALGTKTRYLVSAAPAS